MEWHCFRSWNPNLYELYIDALILIRGQGYGQFWKYCDPFFLFQSRLNCRILTNLMSTLENIMFASGSRGGCSRECILTVQMILTNSNTTFVNFKPLKLWNNLAFRKMTGKFFKSIHSPFWGLKVLFENWRKNLLEYFYRQS